MKEYLINNLYHYTSFESAVKIIASKQLLFSEINKLNDINESGGPNYIIEDPDDNKEASGIMQHFSQISLTTDKPHHRGFDIPAMWGHYGDRGHGACLVFDRKKILQEVERRQLYSKDIHYAYHRLLNDVFYEKSVFGSVKNFIISSRIELFFTKSRDWKYEQEYRIVTLNDNPEPLNISDSLVGIILFSKSHKDLLMSASYLALSNIDRNLNVYRYCPSFQGGGLFDSEDNRIFPKNVFDLTAFQPAIIKESIQKFRRLGK